MSVFGNLCLVGTALCLLGLLNLAVLQKAPGGDAGVGHAWAIVILCVGLLIVAGLTTLAVGLRGGFDRFGDSAGARALVGVGWFALTALGFYLLSDPGTFLPKVVRVAGSFVLPVLVLAWAAVHLNDGLARALPAGAATALTLGIIALSGLPLVGMAAGSVARTVAGMAQRGELDSFQQGIVQHIEATDVQQGIATLLVHTPEGRHPIIRERALARIKSRADWQDEMVRLLRSDAAPEVLGFLSANEVDNAAMFAAAVPEGLQRQAEAIRRRIRNCNHPSNLYAGMLHTEVRLALEVAGAYQAKGADVRPAVQEMKRAFDEPTPYPRPAFAAVDLIDRWLAKQGR
ncbi:hypothetical protein [Aquabacterium humicola]|uniref:hypothetical protein n=1 Tax=Aquabacterium humicola TaxID=3237377 RepID=UPI002542763D|nr:hypothetical protein [Rubrivivax pictus]